MILSHSEMVRVGFSPVGRSSEPPGDTLRAADGVTKMERERKIRGRLNCFHSLSDR